MALNLDPETPCCQTTAEGLVRTGRQCGKKPRRRGLLTVSLLALRSATRRRGTQSLSGAVARQRSGIPRLTTRSSHAPARSEVTTARSTSLP